MKFKVGDRVKIINGYASENLDTVYTVSSINEFFPIIYLEGTENWCSWTEDKLVLATELDIAKHDAMATYQKLRQEAGKRFTENAARMKSVFESDICVANEEHEILRKEAAKRFKENTDRMRSVFNSDIRVAKEEYEMTLKRLEFPYEVKTKYRHRTGDIYLLTKILVDTKTKYTLICLEGVYHEGKSYGNATSTPKEAFNGNEQFFTPLSK